MMEREAKRWADREQICWTTCWEREPIGMSHSSEPTWQAAHRLTEISLSVRERAGGGTERGHAREQTLNTAPARRPPSDPFPSQSVRSIFWLDGSGKGTPAGRTRRHLRPLPTPLLNKHPSRHSLSGSSTLSSLPVVSRYMCH